jgi:hypothetical protein
MPWQPPATYQPDPNLDQILIHSSPGSGSALFDMVMYRQWTHYSWQNKTIEDAWQHLHMGPSNARRAIDTRIVPLEIYDRVVERARQG